MHGNNLKSFSSIRPHTYAVLGAAFGDEGKGRIIDNLIDKLIHTKGIKSVFVIRYQGGNNAGHTIEKNGIKLALHLVPSFVLYPNAKGIMDRGEVIHPEDLETEVKYIEKTIKKSLAGRLFLSQNAILCTDLERAEEVLNRIKSGNSKGGTGRGISPSYAHFVDRTGLIIADLIDENWKDKLTKRYREYKKVFQAFGINLSKTPVPDFAKNSTRTVGNEKLFLQRLEKARNWLLKRGLIANTSGLYRKIYSDTSVGILFEASQAAGLDLHNGTRPDVTSSDTTLSGIKAGTGGNFLGKNISDSYAVMKATYTSSVGARKMPTHILANPKGTPDEKHASWIQETAHEYGTTTGRPRDITFLDIPMLKFNLKISEAKKVILTHLDIARKDTPIKVCINYKDTKGKEVFYEPNLSHLSKVIPNYIELPGWDGAKCQNAKRKNQLPKEARDFIDFLEKNLNLPVVAVTTGPDRKDMITFKGY